MANSRLWWWDPWLADWRRVRKRTFVYLAFTSGNRLYRQKTGSVLDYVVIYGRILCFISDKWYQNHRKKRDKVLGSLYILGSLYRSGRDELQGDLAAASGSASGGDLCCGSWWKTYCKSIMTLTASRMTRRLDAYSSWGMTCHTGHDNHLYVVNDLVSMAAVPAEWPTDLISHLNN